MWTLPNLITILRMGAAAFICCLLFLPNEWAKPIAFVLFVVAALSDIWDGYLARRTNQVTSTGKILDPLADKLLLFATLIPSYYLIRKRAALYGIPLWGSIPACVTLLLLGRELAMTFFRWSARRRGVVIPAARLGKLKTVLQDIFLGLTLLWLAFRDTYQRTGWEQVRAAALWNRIHGGLVSLTLALSTFVTLFSFCFYVYHYRQLFFSRNRRAWVGVITCTLVACAQLQAPGPRTVSSATDPRANATATVLGKWSEQLACAHPGLSGFLLANRGERALQARVVSADLAERTIDAQYFEWRPDAVGRIMLKRLLLAADRGVRVRLLLDGLPVSKDQYDATALSAHPNIEVRFYNPLGAHRLWSLIIDFSRLDHRMHNKLFIADNELAVVGGRNLTDAYFGVDQRYNLRDFDLMTTGPIVRSLSRAFDLYWNSPWAIPVPELKNAKATPLDLLALRQSLNSWPLSSPSVFPYALPSDENEAREWLAAREGELVWAPAEALYDEPQKTSKTEEGPPSRVGARLLQIARGTQNEVLVESAYLVPQPSLLPFLRKLVDRGVRLRILTNSLDSTNLVPVYAGYEKRRRKLLSLGPRVELSEMRADAASRSLYVPTASDQIRLGLHAKAMVFDRRIVFVGSMNLDPRSIKINTEMGLVVWSPVLAEQILDDAEHDLALDSCYRVTLGAHGRTIFTTLRHQKVDRTRFQPGRPSRLLALFFLSLLPIGRFL